MSKNETHIEDGNDIVIEEEYTEDSKVGDSYQKKINSLKEKLEKCQLEKEEYLQGWQRAQADFINYKKNNNFVFQQSKESAVIDMVESLLPVLDSFEMALSGAFDENFKKWITGFEYVHHQFKKILSEQGVQEINPIEESFSPQKHEALEEILTGDKKLDSKIASVILKGYQTSSGRVIRAAQVKVYKYQK